MKLEILAFQHLLCTFLLLHHTRQYSNQQLIIEMAAARLQPSALEPYLLLPTELSLTLLTGTLGFSAHFLTSRFVGSALRKGSAEEDDDDAAVLLVSWMRDAAFWKSEIRRGTVRLRYLFES